MEAVIRFLKNWTLPVAMCVGAIGYFIRQFAVYGAAQADDERFGRHIDTVADFRSAVAYLL